MVAWGNLQQFIQVLKMRLKRFLIAVCAALFCSFQAVPAQAYPLQWLDDAAKDAADNLGDAAKNIGDFLNCQVAIIKAPYCNKPPEPEPPPPPTPGNCPIPYIVSWSRVTGDFDYSAPGSSVTLIGPVSQYSAADGNSTVVGFRHAGGVYNVISTTGAKVEGVNITKANASQDCAADQPAPTPSPSPSSSPGDGSPTSPGGNGGGGSNPGEPGKWGDPSGGGGGGNGSPSPGASPSASPQQETNPNKASKFAKPNFVAYAVFVFSKKFPFDIFASVAAPPPGGLTCPTYSFFEKPFELCIVKDMVSILKFPALLGFLVWCIMAI